MILEETQALPQNSDSRIPEQDPQPVSDIPRSTLIQLHPDSCSSSEKPDSDTELKHGDQSRPTSDTVTIMDPSSESRPDQETGARTERPTAGRPKKFDFSAPMLAEKRSSTSKKADPTPCKRRKVSPPADQSAACAFPPECEPCEPAECGEFHDFMPTNIGKGPYSKFWLFLYQIFSLVHQLSSRENILARVCNKNCLA